MGAEILIKKILVVGLLVMMFSGVSSAATYVYIDSLSSTTCAQNTWHTQSGTIFEPSTSGNTLYAYLDQQINDVGCGKCYGTPQGCIKIYYSPILYYEYARCIFYGNVEQVDTPEIVTDYAYLHVATGTHSMPYNVDAIFIFSNEAQYIISGNIDCCDSVDLKIYDGSTYKEIEENMTGDSYSFDVLDNTSYQLIFQPSGDIYSFTVNESNINYDYDACIHTIYNFKESCGNLIPDSEGFYIEKIGTSVIAANNFYEASGILDIMGSSADNIYVHSDTFIGGVGWHLDPIVNDTTYNLTNTCIGWGLKVIVQNESDGSLINDAMVRVNQSCYCTSDYSTRQKMSTNGMCTFSDMSLQDAGLYVMKTGYKIINEDSTGYDVFLSGRSNFSSKTWIVKLALSTSNNTSAWYETGHKVDIHFRDINGNRTSQILDTDSDIYLYYENNNSENEAMTLKFQSSSTHTYFIDENSWSIPHDSIGHKTIPNAQFTPYTYAYRAVIYNSSIYGWNMTIPLTVRNATKEDNQHYGNLSTNLWFMYASDGKIDSREDMRIISHAQSNNTTLMNIDLEVYKNGSLLCYKNLTASDYAGASYPYYYSYEPSYSYVAGANYTIKMFGFDRTLLQVRYVDCITDSVTRKNKLTIVVKDNYGHNLNNAFVYLEGYGSLSTGINSYYNSYEGLSNKYYRYKATKTNYDGSGWADVTISDSDKIVTYVLTATGDMNVTSMEPVKMDDNEMKNLYYCLMMFLLIFILFGGLMYLAK